MKNSKDDQALKCIQWVRTHGMGGLLGATKEEFFAEVVDERTYFRLLKRKYFRFMIDQAQRDHMAMTERMLSARLLDIAMGKESGNVEAITYLLNNIAPERWRRTEAVETISNDDSLSVNDAELWIK